MRKITFEEAVAQIHREDPRYDPAAYFFIREALDWTTRSLKKPAAGAGRHVTAAELLDGIRQFALREYGPLAMTVLQTWGVRQCADFGRIVFNLVNKKFLGKTDNDSVHDFDHGFDFAAAFHAPFVPEQNKCRSAPQRGAAL